MRIRLKIFFVPLFFFLFFFLPSFLYADPPQFNSFSPSNGTTDVSLTPTLSWSASDPNPADTLTYDIYFGASSPPPLVLSNQTATTYQPVLLSFSTRYYWRIVARDNNGIETSMSEVYFDTVSLDIIVDHSPANVNYPQVAADGNGHVYVVWEDNRNGGSDIYFNHSSDYGSTWQPTDIRLDTDTPGTGSSVTPQITCDDSGHVYVVWRDTRSGNPDVYFNYSSDYGVTWHSPDKQLGTIPYNPNPQYPKIACDNTGHVYTAWNDGYFNTSSDNGATWLSQAKRISTLGGEETQLTCDQTGNVYVAWRLGTTDVLFNYSFDHGNTNTWLFNDLIISSPNAIPSGALSLDSDESGHVYCAWHDERNNASSPDVYFNSSLDHGNTWGASDTILNTGTPGTTYSIWPDMACDETGHVYVTWYDRRSGSGLGDIYLNYSSDAGGSWQNPDKRIDTDSPGAVDSGYPNISTDNSGQIYIIWTDDQADVGGPGLYLNYSLDYGTTWLSENMKIGSGGFHPQIVTHGSRSYVIRDNSDIVFTGLVPLLPIYPSPADGTTKVSITPTLSWRGGNLYLDNTLTYDVYFGTSSPPSLVSPNQAGTTHIPGTLDYFTTYYWQVLSRDSSGVETLGPIWSFTTMSNPPEFGTFSPPDGAIDVDTSPTLSWTATDPNPGDTITFDVYFGNTNPPPLKAVDQTTNTYNTGLLWSKVTYFWKIVARDNHGSETVGPVISFTTLNHPPQFEIDSYSPSDTATGISFTPTLTWSAVDPDPDDILRYDIYFGTSSPPPLVVSDKATPIYRPGQVTPLEHWTVYYWKVVARDSDGAQTESPILSFRTLSNPPTLTNFSPANKSIEISVTPTLSWTASDPDPDDIFTYDIYFGTINPPPLVVSDHPVANYQPGEISYSIKYYWKVVARDHHGVEKAGPILSFTTFSRLPEFLSFTPPNLSTNIDIKPTLSWDAYDPDPEDTITYDVYFASSPNPPLATSGLTSKTYKPGELASETKYYWKIVARDNHEKEKVGPVLSFTTCSRPPIFTNTKFKPGNQSTGVSTAPTLRWYAYDPDAGDTVTYNVYFGTLPDPPLVLSNQTSTTFKAAGIPAISPLLPLTTYYWKVVAHDNHGTEKVGPVLSFTTRNISISSINPNPCQTRQVISIIGQGFGDTQGTSEIHLATKVFSAGSTNIKMWSETRIDFEVPAYSAWSPGTTKTLNLWVRVNGLNSNKFPLTINKP